MRPKLVVGNWKMNLDRKAAVELARAIIAGAPDEDRCELAVCPPFVYLEAVGQELDDTHVSLGAQNMYHEPSGAFTGEVSGAMLRDLECELVILGHSERRHILGETDAEINRKVHAALTVGLSPIVCVGELLSEREAGHTAAVIQRQFEQSLAAVTDEQMLNVVLAYEPVWAIGTGKTATPEQAQEVHADLRKLIRERYNAEVADQVWILYGGSVKAANAAALLNQEDVDGALVGGASLSADEFLAIAAAAPEVITPDEAA